MNESSPIKRVNELIPLSHDHHHGLRLSLKIRAGFRRNIDPYRIKKYTDWFYRTYLVPHFELEEKYVFPILGKNSELVRRALAEHRKLNRLFQATLCIEKNLVQIEENLEKHIRFEERILFNEVQQIATHDELEEIASIHNANTVSAAKWSDEFWK